MRINRTATFKRNYKYLAKKHYDMSKLRDVIQLILADDQAELKRKYRDHGLTGNHKGKRELHIEGDWLLIYMIENNRLDLWLMATGSHDELFKKTK